MDNDNERIQNVLEFWFGKPGDADYLKSRSFWYGSNKTDDDCVRNGLGRDYEDAKNGRLDHWSETSEGALALILLLDQVPRNIHRDTPEAYATDDQALVVAKKVLENGWDSGQPNIIRRYLYSPFNHSETLADQEQSVKLFTEMGDSEHLYWAKNFYNIIKTHGRFPHRDRILRRML